jgi:hypothetical protein
MKILRKSMHFLAFKIKRNKRELLFRKIAFHELSATLSKYNPEFLFSYVVN